MSSRLLPRRNCLLVKMTHHCLRMGDSQVRNRMCSILQEQKKKIREEIERGTEKQLYTKRLMSPPTILETPSSSVQDRRSVKTAFRSASRSEDESIVVQDVIGQSQKKRRVWWVSKLTRLDFPGIRQLFSSSGGWI